MTLAGRKLLESGLVIAEIGEIGEMVGYQSNTVFQRIFKRLVGVTPSRCVGWQSRNQIARGSWILSLIRMSIMMSLPAVHAGGLLL